MTTADLYAAWITAGNHLQPIGAWISERWPYIAIPAIAATTLAWILRHRRGDRRSQDDKQGAWLATCKPRPEPGRPGTDTGLYLDCIAIYGDSDELDRLRDAIHQHRKEKP